MYIGWTDVTEGDSTTFSVDTIFAETCDGSDDAVAVYKTDWNLKERGEKVYEVILQQLVDCANWLRAQKDLNWIESLYAQEFF